MQYRNPLKVVLLSIFTFGIYAIYWTWEVKNDLNKLDKKIPNILLSLIPIVNIFFWYRFFLVFSRKILKNNINPTLLTFLNAIYPYFIAMILSQSRIFDLIDILYIKPGEPLSLPLIKIFLILFCIMLIFSIFFLPLGIIQYYINKKLKNFSHI